MLSVRKELPEEVVVETDLAFEMPLKDAPVAAIIRDDIVALPSLARSGNVGFNVIHAKMINGL